MSKIWTRNYDNLFSALFGTFGGNGTSTAVAPTYEYPCIRDAVGIYRTAIDLHTMGGAGRVAGALSINTINGYLINDNDTYDNYHVSTPCYNYIQLGTGTGEVSKDDYRLFLSANSNLVLGTIKTSWAYNDSTHEYTKSFKVPVIYSGATDITITEFGIFSVLPDGTTTNHGGHYYMMYHEFLDNPITLTENDTIEINFSQSIVQPNYTPYAAV